MEALRRRFEDWFRVLRKHVGRMRRAVRPQQTWDALRASVNEPEMALLSALVDPSRTTIDVGAANGQYAAKLAEMSPHCIAFEARPDQARLLQRLCRKVDSRVTVEAVALSDRAGTAVLRVLVMDPGRSTMEEANQLTDDDGSDSREVTVPMRTLDSYGYEDVGFIKVDVEGHELSVLNGARRTIEANRPRMLVEVEDRHRARAVASVQEYFDAQGYQGYFLIDGEIRGIGRFEPRIHQSEGNIGGWRSGWKRTGVYVNNFIFVPTEETADFRERAAELLADARPHH